MIANKEIHWKKFSIKILVCTNKKKSEYLAFGVDLANGNEYSAEIRIKINKSEWKIRHKPKLEFWKIEWKADFQFIETGCV